MFVLPELLDLHKIIKLPDLDGTPLRQLFLDSFRKAVCGKLHRGQFLTAEFCRVEFLSILDI